MELITYDPESSVRVSVEKLFSFSESERSQALAKAMDAFDHKHGCPGNAYILPTYEQIHNYERNLRLADAARKLERVDLQN